MNRVRPHLFGFALAVFLGAWHALWAFLIWAGAAQWLLDFVFRLHMIAPPYQRDGFQPGHSNGLVLIAAAIGYVSGWFIGVVWNHFALRSAALWRFERHEPRHAQ